MWTIDKLIKIFGRESVIVKIVRYFSKIYGIIGEVAVPQLLQSIALMKIANRYDLLRLRKHVMLHWDPGWVKSTLLRHMTMFIPREFTWTVETALSEAVVRGSAVESRGRYRIIPPVLVKDLVIIPELSTAISKSRPEVVEMFLEGLESSIMTVRLVKLARALDRTENREILEQLGIEIVDNNTAIRYRPKATVWTATHTLDNLPRAHQQAFLDRFTIVKISRKLLDKDLLRIYDGLLNRDVDYEKQLVQEFQELLDTISFTDDDFKYVHQVVKEFIVSLREEGFPLSPRDCSELLRTAIATNILVAQSPAPKPVLWSALEQMIPHLERKTLLEKIAEALRNKPMTIDEICDEFGISEDYATRIVKCYLRASKMQMGTDEKGRPIVKYYLA